MAVSILAIIGGFILLVWSADRFVDGAAATARHFGMPSLVIGMVIVGFGTSAPEMVVSAMAALDGNPDLALGNALGSNIVNTGLIIGITALIAPIAVHSGVVRKELPLLMLVALLLGGLLWDNRIERLEAGLMLAGFAALLGWTLFTSLRRKSDPLAREMEQELAEQAIPLGRALLYLLAGLILLVVSSRILVWGAVSIAEALGVSDLIIGLTIVALGTSLPELASSVVAARKGEHDIALGNIVGSNLFNILAVVGIAGSIAPMTAIAPEVLYRDWATMSGFFLLLFLTAWGFRGPGRINRMEGGVLLAAFVAYNGWLVLSVTGG